MKIKLKSIIKASVLCTIACVLVLSSSVLSARKNPSFSIDNRPDRFVDIIGNVVFVELEGGFFGIIDDDGRHYEPINLPEEFEIDGLRIKFSGRPTPGYSIYMWGMSIGISVICEIVEDATGAIVFNDFEGGFYGIVGDEGSHYDPANIPEEYKVEGLQIRFSGDLLDISSFHMWGEVLELTDIVSIATETFPYNLSYILGEECTVIASPVVEDLDDDGFADIVVALKEPAAVCIIHPATEEIITISVSGEGFISTPAVGDFVGDATPEIIALSRDGKLHVFTPDGIATPVGFPIQLPYDEPVSASPILGDFSEEPGLEILVGSTAYSLMIPRPSTLFLINGDGDILWDKSFSYGNIVTTPSVADVDGDGLLEIFLETSPVSDGIYVIRKAMCLDGHTGEILWDYTIPIPGASQGIGPAWVSPVVADIDNNDEMDLLVYSNNVYSTGSSHFFIGSLDAMDCSEQWSSSNNFEHMTALVVADVMNDSRLETIYTSYTLEGVPTIFLRIVDCEGYELAEFQFDFIIESDDVFVYTSMFTSLLVVDVDDDTIFEIVATTEIGDIYTIQLPSGEYSIASLNGRFSRYASPAIGDFDHDEETDLVVVTRNGLLYAFNLEDSSFDSEHFQWATRHHDNHNTNCYHSNAPWS